VWSMTEKMEMLCRVLDLDHVVLMEWSVWSMMEKMKKKKKKFIKM